MISTNDVKPGMALDLPEGLFSVVEYQHVKPGKGKAFVRMKLKNVRTGAVLDRTFRAGENVEQARIDRRDFTFLYRDDMGFNFMDAETYEQLSVPEDLVGDSSDFLTDGMTVRMAMYEGTPVDLELPASTSARVSVATWDGDLSTDFAVEVPDEIRGRRYSFTLGSGSAQIEIEAFDGDIDVGIWEPEEEEEY